MIVRPTKSLQIAIYHPSTGTLLNFSWMKMILYQHVCPIDLSIFRGFIKRKRTETYSIKYSNPRFSTNMPSSFLSIASHAYPHPGMFIIATSYLHQHILHSIIEQLVFLLSICRCFHHSSCSRSIEGKPKRCFISLFLLSIG